MANRRKKLDAGSRMAARSGTAGKIADQFGVRAGTNREAVLKVLAPKLGKPVPRAVLCKAIYKNSKPENVPAFTKVLNGLEYIATENKLPYRFEHSGRGEDAAIALVKGRKRA